MADLDEIYGREAIEDARRVLDSPYSRKGQISGATVMDFARAAQRGRLEQVQKPTTQEKVVVQNKEVARTVDVDKALLAKVVNRSVDEHFRFMVDGSPLPPLEELKTKHFDWVSDVFDGRVWHYHKSCVRLVPGTRNFLVKHFNKELWSDEAIAWGEKWYRPATHLELFALGCASPFLQWKFVIAALGSSALFGDYHRCVAMLHGGSLGRTLEADNFHKSWDASVRFLFVRK